MNLLIPFISKNNITPLVPKEGKLPLVKGAHSLNFMVRYL